MLLLLRTLLGTGLPAAPAATVEAVVINRLLLALCDSKPDEPSPAVPGPGVKPPPCCKPMREETENRAADSALDSARVGMVPQSPSTSAEDTVKPTINQQSIAISIHMARVDSQSI